MAADAVAPVTGDTADGDLAAGEELSRRAYVHEVFMSVQGEGVFVGERQIFLRLAGCNIRCPWCDTPEALAAGSVTHARVETEPGGLWAQIPNPMTVEDVVPLITHLREGFGPVRWVALTGGEPTIWGRFLQLLLPRLKQLGMQTYLETNSHYPETIEALLPHLDFISADIKVPLADYSVDWGTYERVLAQISRSSGQVKVVVDGESPVGDIESIAERMSAHNASMPLVLQPVTPVAGVGCPPSFAHLFGLQRRALAFLSTVRIVGQTHKMLAVR